MIVGTSGSFGAVPRFESDGLALHYVERGPRDAPPVVLLHGLLWSSWLQTRLARLLDDEYRVLLLDLRGHGRSDRPTDPAVYDWRHFVGDVVALLDHVEVDRAVVGGVSLGANVGLGMGFHAPERLAGMILEMPVLSRGHNVGRAVFGRMAAAFEGARPVLGPFSRVVASVPVPGWRRLPDLVAVRDMLAVDPESASAMLRGLLDDVTLPEGPEVMGLVDVPALVVGHRFDRLHSFDDARDLARWLPHAELVAASNITEFRIFPGRLAGHIRRFLADVYGEGEAVGRTAPAGTTTSG